ncbi:MAG: response regulator [Verrucomicrobia bacterium]|jgi:FixJ family two-component response regulator|nr:response regulator [Verrucomicrobiota bacterium]
MTKNSHLVVVLDDDPSVLKSLSRLLTTRGYQVRTHSDADEFLRAGPPAGTACVLLDQNLGRITGLQVHAEMRRRQWNIPTVFLTAQADTAAVVAAIRGGADDYITKPYDPVELMASVARALQHAEENQEENDSLAALRARAARLTDRERTVVSHILTGLLNKEIADRLHIALVTVKIHRGNAMKKLGARNSAELGRIAAALGLDRQP